MIHVSAILFDLDDTLVVERQAADDVLLDICRRVEQTYGVSAERLRDTLYETARSHWRALPTIDYCRAIGISSWEGLWAEFSGDDPGLERLASQKNEYRMGAWREALKVHGISNLELAASLSSAFVEERGRRHAPDPEAPVLLAALRERYSLAVVTNGSPDIQRKKLEGAGLLQFFDCVVISGDIGIGKPDPEIFQSAIRQLNADANATLMVGDSWERDVMGAYGAGVRAAWLSGGRAPEGSAPPGLITLRTLGELGDHLCDPSHSD